MPLPDFPEGTTVTLTGSALRFARKLAIGEGMAFGDGRITADEAAGTFTWIRVCDDRDDITAVRDAIVRSDVSGREGRVSREMFRRA